MKTELQKCLTGELYDAHDPIFKSQKARSNQFLSQYNQTPYDQADVRKQLLKENLGAFGEYATIGTPFLCDMARNIYIADKVSVNMNCSLMDSNTITIDTEVMIAPNVQIYTGTHPVNDAERMNPNWATDKQQHFVLTRSLPVHIKKRCWIGGGVIILPGVTIGEGTVIGAGSVVTHNIPDHVVAVGNPCHVLRPIQ